MRIFEAAKICCDRLGLLAVYHRLVNRDTLTVVMFHRVLPDSGLADADPDYAMSDGLFAKCLAFFRRHYAIVGLDALLAAQGGGEPLPSRALLITFDDGWDDNLEFAVPLLAAQAVPAVVFAATDAVTNDQNWWWQEVLLSAFRRGQASYETLWQAIPGDWSSLRTVERPLRLLLRYGAGDPDIRRRVLARYVVDGARRHMLTVERLRSLADAGIAVGSHGAGHLPLSLIGDPEADIERSRRALAEALPGRVGAAFSFPHGRHSPRAIAAAFAAGFRLLFTSDPIVNKVVKGLPPAILGRIEIPAGQIADRFGRLQRHRLAAWMFLRPRRLLARVASAR